MTPDEMKQMEQVLALVKQALLAHNPRLALHVLDNWIERFEERRICLNRFNPYDETQEDQA